MIRQEQSHRNSTVKIQAGQSMNILESNLERIRVLRETKTLGEEDLRILLETITQEEEEELYTQARQVCEEHYGKAVFLRGLIEFSSFCKNDCYY